MANGVFNFNFLARLLSEILGGPKFTLGGPTPPWTPPSGEIFVPKASTLQCILGGPKFTLGGPVPPVRPRAENFLYPRRVRYYV